MNRLLIIAMALLMVGLTACARKKPYPKPPAYVPHPQNEFPITASYAFTLPFMTDEEFEWVKEAGFNTITQRLSTQDFDTLLSRAGSHGIIVACSQEALLDPSTIGGVLERYKDNPVVWGFSMIDEPKASQFPRLRQLNDSVVKIAPNQNAFFNLLPAMSSEHLGTPDYRSYVEEYVRTVNPPYISYDIYPVKIDKKGKVYVDPALYRTIEVIRDVSMASGRPFWSYILCNEHWMYPEPTEQNIRFQVFTALAYGAQGLKYYTYQLPEYDRTTREYSNGPLDWDGNRTATWYMVRNVNREVRCLSDVFLGSEVVSVTQTGAEIPDGTKRNHNLPRPFLGIESFGRGVTVSHLKKGNAQFLLLVNRDVENSQRIRLSRAREVIRRYGDGTSKRDFDPYLTLEPGGYALFQF